MYSGCVPQKSIRSQNHVNHSGRHQDGRLALRIIEYYYYIVFLNTI
jgi:hypothetical protein